MSKFKDRTGSEHQLEISYGTARTLKAECDLDLPACLTSPDKLVEIMKSLADPVTLVASLAVILKRPSVEELFELFDGDSLVAAETALIDAIIDFFPDRQRQILRRLLTSLNKHQQQTGQAAVSQAEAAIDRLDWSTVLNTSATHGNGLNDLSAVLEVTATV